MKSEIKKVFHIVLFMAGLVISVTNAQAQEGAGMTLDEYKKSILPTEPPKNTMVQIASVELYNAHISQRSDEELTIEFTLVNQKGVQPGVRYGIVLKSKATEGRSSSYADTYVSDEVLTLQENIYVDKSLRYSLRNVPSGSYEAFVIARNADGVPLATGSLGSIAIGEKSGNLSIDSASCYMTVVNDSATEKKYNLMQGVDILSEENLQLHCDIANTSGVERKISPKFATYFRSIIGRKIDEKELASISVPKGTMGFVFDIPKVPSPQAYDFSLVLTDEAHYEISNRIIGHYVISGYGASIQNVYLEKDYYAPGDTANVSFSWAGIVGNFPDARNNQISLDKATVIVSIESLGKSCGTEGRKDLVNGRDLLVTVPVQISQNCLDPTVLVKIIDEKGAVLADENYQITTLDKNKPLGEGSVKKVTFRIEYMLLILLLISAIVFGIRKWRKTKGRNGANIAAAVLLLGTGLLLNTKSASAASFLDVTPGGHYVNYQVGLNSNSFSPGANIKVSAYVLVGSCGNEWDYVGLVGNINGATKTILSGVLPGSRDWGPFNQNFTAPGGSGVYDAKFWSILSGVTIKYDITGTPVYSGQCGPLATQPGEAKNAIYISNALNNAARPSYNCTSYEGSCGVWQQGTWVRYCAWYWWSLVCTEPFFVPWWGGADTRWVSNGTCGSNCSYNTCYACGMSSAPATDFCTSGDSPYSIGDAINVGDPVPNDKVVPMTESSGKINWAWNCLGSGGGGSALCKTQQVEVVQNYCDSNYLKCANGGALIGSINGGGIDDPVDNTNALFYTWVCAKDGNKSYCTQRRDTNIAACGLAHAIPAVDTPTQNLCASSETPDPVPHLDAAGKNFVWVCSGANCSAPKFVPPTASCGELDVSGNGTCSPSAGVTTGATTKNTTTGKSEWTCTPIGGAVISCQETIPTGPAGNSKWKEVVPW